MINHNLGLSANFIATGDFNRFVQDYVVTVLNLDKNFKQKLDPNLGIYVCKADENAGACLADYKTQLSNYSWSIKNR